MTSDPTSPRGHLVAIGGAEDKSSDLEVLSRVFELTPENDRPVCIIASASGVPDETLPAYKAAFERLGATRVYPLDIRERDEASAKENVRAVQDSGVVFFTGGDQLRLTYALGGSDVLAAIQQRYADGAVVAGTSAGAAAMSATMIYDGAAADALHKGAVKMTTGLGFVDGLVIDSHFLERGRFTRLMEVGTTNPAQLGIGLGEDAGVIIHPHRIAEAIGSGHVIIVDSSELASSNVAEIGTGEPVAVEHMVMHALISGYGYDVEARRYLTPEALKAEIGKTR